MNTLLYGGQQLSMNLCMMFNALLAHSFVPSDFCKRYNCSFIESKHGDATQQRNQIVPSVCLNYLK